MTNNFAKSTTITFFTRMANLVIGVIISILLARMLGPDGRGIYALAILIPSLAFIFTNLGINSSTVYFLGRKKYSPQVIAGSNIIFSVFISLLAIILILLSLLFFKNTFLAGVPLYAFILAILIVPFRIFISNSINVLLGIHRYITYNVMSFLDIFVHLILLLLLFLLSSFTILTALIAYLAASIITLIIIYIVLKKIISTFRFRLNKDYLRDAFTYGSKSYLSNVISFLHLRIDTLIINYFLNPLAVGFYAVATSLTERLWLLSESASVILFPKIASERNDEAKRIFTPVLCRNILLLTIIGAILLLLLGKWIILLLYSKKFLNAVMPFQILLIGTIFVSGSKILANDIAGRGKPMINTYINIVSLFINIILNIILIPKYGIAGAAYATTISYSLIFFIRGIVYSRISRNRIIDILFVKPSDFKLYTSLFKSLIHK